MNLDFQITPKQQLFMDTDAFEVLYAVQPAAQDVYSGAGTLLYTRWRIRAVGN